MKYLNIFIVFTFFGLLVVSCKTKKIVSNKAILSKVKTITFSQIESDSSLVRASFYKDTLPAVKKREFVLSFSDSTIQYKKIFYRENGDIESGNPICINRINNLLCKRQTYKPLDKKMINDRIFLEGNIDSIKITKYKNLKKSIQNYNCYKVIINAFDKSNNILETTYTYNLYVTEDINLDYHPIFGRQKFIEDFYPLEIKKQVK